MIIFRPWTVWKINSIYHKFSKMQKFTAMFWVIFFFFPEWNNANVLSLERLWFKHTRFSRPGLEAIGSTGSMLQNNEKTFSVINNLLFFTWEKMTQILSHVLNVLEVIDFCREGWESEGVDGTEMSREADRRTKTDRQTKKNGKMSKWYSWLTCRQTWSNFIITIPNLPLKTQQHSLNCDIFDALIFLYFMEMWTDTRGVRFTLGAQPAKVEMGGLAGPRARLTNQRNQILLSLSLMKSMWNWGARATPLSVSGPE